MFKMKFEYFSILNNQIIQSFLKIYF